MYIPGACPWENVCGWLHDLISIHAPPATVGRMVKKLPVMRAVSTNERSYWTYYVCHLRHVTRFKENSHIPCMHASTCPHLCEERHRRACTFCVRIVHQTLSMSALSVTRFARVPVACGARGQRVQVAPSHLHNQRRCIPRSVVVYGSAQDDGTLA